MKFRFYVFEQLATSVEIEAESEDDAYAIGEEMYEKGEIVLYPDDYVDSDFEVEEIPEEDEEKPEEKDAIL